MNTIDREHKSFQIEDYSDVEFLKQIIEEFKDSEGIITGTNEDGEDTSYNIFDDRIEVITHQNNGWIRRNVYWLDGTREELFQGRWDR